MTSSPTYPEQPWDLRGDLFAATYVAPIGDLPPGTLAGLPPGHRLVCLGDRAVVTVAWVDYAPSGVLAYRELMSTLLVRAGRRLRPAITHIWVDSPASRDGGRALWSIPKELTEITHAAGRFAAPAIAAGPARVRLRLPGSWPMRFSIAQRDLQEGGPGASGHAVVSPVSVRSPLALASLRLDARPDGPLGFLRGRRPVVALAMPGFRMSFGRR